MDTLSALERKIAILVAQGHYNHEIGEKLCLSDQTIRNYLSKIYEKLGFNNRAQLTSYAWQMGWIGQSSETDQDRSSSQV